MSFASLTFFVFLPVVFTIYWLLRRPVLQNLALIFASYFFYAWWDWRFCGLMLGSSLVDYWIGYCLHRSDSRQTRRFLLILSLVCNLGVLVFFKYCNFFLDNLQLALSSVGWQMHPVTLSIVLPVGISFYTFQTLSYTFDIYRRQLRPADSLINYLAFVSFFPQLVAGPIERARHLLPQFAAQRRFSEKQGTDGLRLILWGIFKKLVVADHLAFLVDDVYGSATGGISGVIYGLATVCFAFQIYCDFSAYSDIARGTGQLFGIRLMRNFAYPYFSTSLAEFWRRWHISLSTWFRDYVYIPLGGNRVPVWRSRLNLLLTFLISGVWHGAAWTFVYWGAINGLLLMVRRSKNTPSVAETRQFWVRPIDFVRVVQTFCIVCVGWVFFRADNLNQAFWILHSIGRDLFDPLAYASAFDFVFGEKVYRKAVLFLLGFVLLEWLQRTRPCPLQMPVHVGTPLRWAAYTGLIWFTLRCLPPEAGHQFIYFEF